MCKVSVIIPIYNAERYLEKSLENYLAQDYGILEFILIDDGSTDESLNICRDFEKRDSRVIVITQTNRGVSAARNSGIRKASGDYIAFFDADDYVDRNMISRMIKEAQSCDADVVSCGISMELEKEDGQITEQAYLFFKGSPLKLSNRIEISNKMLEMWEYGVPYNVVNKLYKKSLIVDNKIFFQNLSMGEDLLFNSHILPECEKIVLLPFCFYHYVREREGAATAHYVSRWFEIRKSEHYRILDFFKEYRLPEKITDNDMEYISRRFVNRTLGCMENEFRKGNTNDRYREIKNMICDEDVQKCLERGKRFSLKIKIVVWMMQHKMYHMTFLAISIICGIKKLSPRLFEYLKYRR